MIQPIFIVGLPRTGSTLWSNIIGIDETVMRFGEMHYLNPWHYDINYFVKNEAGELLDDENARLLVNKLFSGKIYKGLRGNYWQQIQKINPVELQDRLATKFIKSDRSLSALFKLLVAESTEIRGYSKCLIKFPVHISRIGWLLKVCPEAKVIHITRDPRATALSKTNDPGGIAVKFNSFFITRVLIRQVMMIFVALQYIQSSIVHSRYKDNPNYALFKYEDLLFEPENVIRELCEFAGLNYSVAMLQPRKGQPSSITGKRKHGFDPASAVRWKEKMNGVEVRFFTWITRSSMKRFGYDP